MPSKDPKRLAVAITDALSNPIEAKRRALVGQAQSHQTFDTALSAKNIVRTYSDILGGNNPSEQVDYLPANETNSRRAA